LNALAAIGQKLMPSDSLLIHTSNHGRRINDSTEAAISTYEGSTSQGNEIWGTCGATEFANALSGMQPFAQLMVMMEQCCSGGFKQAILSASTANRTSFASAVGPYTESKAGEYFDSFAEDWIAAMAGTYANGRALDHAADTDQNGRVSAREAFDYALSVVDPVDSPLFDETNGGGLTDLWG